MTAHRIHAGQPYGGDKWTWDKPRKPAHFRTCSYCGCIHPEDLVAEPNWTAEWADRKYGWPHKFYVSIPDRNGELDWLGGSTSEMSDEELARYGWKRVKDLTSKEREVLERENLMGDYKVVGIGTRDTHHAKFYTEHLHDPNLAPGVVDAIHQTSGLIFEWLPDGRVAWRPAS